MDIQPDSLILIGLESILVFEHFTPLFILCGTLGITPSHISRVIIEATLLLPERLSQGMIIGKISKIFLGENKS